MNGSGKRTVEGCGGCTNISFTSLGSNLGAVGIILAMSSQIYKSRIIQHTHDLNRLVDALLSKGREGKFVDVVCFLGPLGTLQFVRSAKPGLADPHASANVYQIKG